MNAAELNLAGLADALASTAAALAAVAQALRQPSPDHSHSLTLLPKTDFAPVAPAAQPALAPVDAHTVREVINEFLIAKARAGRSDRYLRQLRVVLQSFASGRALTPIADVSLPDVEKWLYGQGWSARTQRGYVKDVRTLLNFARRRGYVREVVAGAVELPGVAGTEAPGIHTPDQVALVLEAARKTDLDVMRHLAIRYFTGVRSAEAHRLREENILADRGVLEVPAVKAKTRRRRLVTIQPALSAWLALGGQLRGLSPDTVRRAVRLAGVAWPANVTRHSFVSYHLAAFESAGKTALEAGHSEAMLFAHYRALVTREVAEKFWALRPSMPQ
jgi:integrase